jgi:hypothetical protein
MKRKPLRRGDPIEHQIELALNPGAFIGDRSCFSFVSGLDEVAAKIRDLAKTDPARAIALYETFRAGCYAKVEELDDSSGSFGQFVDELICAWIKARQASAADPDETATKLLAWMDDDPYGFCYGIEKDAVKVFDKAGLAAFEKRITARFEAAATAKPTPGKSLDQPEYLRRRWSEVLRTLYLAQRNIAAYLALTGETGLTAQDCHALATLFVTRRKPDEAMAWVDRGMELDRKTQHRTARYNLEKLQRELLTKLGRGGEALDVAWAEFRKNPDKYTYDVLMKLVPKGERQTWHEKAMDAIDVKGADLQSLIALLLETKEVQRLADLVRGAADQALEQASHYTTEPAAKKLEKAHPELAARLWRAQAMRIVNAKKSRYYDAALSNFERAKRCYERAGFAAEWEETVRQVRARHHRKTGFISDFEALAAGVGKAVQPSFLERAKARWGGRVP